MDARLRPNRGLNHRSFSADPSEMAGTRIAENERAVWLLKHHGFQVLVLSEDDRIVISNRFDERREADEMMAAAVDLKRDPSTSLGPSPVQFSLDELVSTRLRVARDRLDLETDSEIHRIGGWTNRAVVVGGRDTIGTPAAGGAASVDAHRRIRHRIAQQTPSSEHESLDIPNERLSPSLQIRPWRMMVQHWFDVLATVVLGAVLAIGSLPPASSLDFVRLAIAALCFVAVFRLEQPSPLTVDHEGICWGTESRKKMYRWAAVGPFVGVPGNGRGLILFVRNDLLTVQDPLLESVGEGQLLSAAQDLLATEVETLIEPTSFMSKQQRDLFLATVALHKPELVVLSDKPARRRVGANLETARSKPLVPIAVLNQPRLRFWFIALPPAVIVPLFVVIFFLIPN